MAKLKSATRNRLPAPEVKARGRATEMERKGKLSPAQAARIRAKGQPALGRISESVQAGGLPCLPARRARQRLRHFPLSPLHVKWVEAEH